MMFYNHSAAFRQGVEVDYNDEYDLEIPPLNHPNMEVDDKGNRVINR